MEKENEIKIPFLKIIYFDEEAATDLIYMKNKGKVVESIIGNKSTESNFRGNTEAELGSKISLLSLLGAKFGFGINASIAQGSEHLINQAITNTVLTDYLDLIMPEYRIIKFKNATIKPYENSLSYYKILTPYMLMTEGKMDAGDIKLNVQLMDEAIKNGKGYYELILTDSDNNINILRFNLKSFKNSYSLADLVKMSLTYHAVKVGCIELSDLDIKKEFSFEDKSYVDGTKLAEFNIVDGKEDVDVYDVILAGVEND